VAVDLEPSKGSNGKGSGAGGGNSGDATASDTTDSSGGEGAEGHTDVAAAPFQPWKQELSREDAFRQALGEGETIGCVDDRALRQLSAGGCPDEHGLRGVVWRYLLDQVSHERLLDQVSHERLLDQVSH
jgi:hypothetical protein